VPAHSKIALAALALALSCAPALAQGDSPADSPAAPDAGGPGGGMHRGGPGRDGDGFGRGGRMGWHRGMGMEGRGMALGRLLNDPSIREQIGVSADQAAKIRQQEADFRKTEIRDRADLQVKQIDLRELMAADKPDRAAIDAKLQEISTSRLALEKASVNYRLNSREALTADQKQKLRDLLRSRRESQRGPSPNGARRAGRRGGAPPPGNPPAAPAPPAQ
jgi:Spy/CpxP family protein refolding chaperone